ncbi:MAG: 50S ribosomal protein L9 [bacterium]
MKVILRKHFENLGEAGTVVDVKEGYALNYLIPRQIAYIASAGNIKALKEEKKQSSMKESKELAAANSLKAELEKTPITIRVKVGEEEKLFGSVTNQMISDAIKEKGFDIDKRKVEIVEPIKALGIYEINVKLHHSVIAVVKTWIVREDA